MYDLINLKKFTSVDGCYYGYGVEIERNITGKGWVLKQGDSGKTFITLAAAKQYAKENF